MNIAVQKSSHEFSKNSQPNHRNRSGDLLQSLLFGWCLEPPVHPWRYLQGYVDCKEGIGIHVHTCFLDCLPFEHKFQEHLLCQFPRIFPDASNLLKPESKKFLSASDTLKREDALHLNGKEWFWHISASKWVGQQAHCLHSGCWQRWWVFRKTIKLAQRETETETETQREGALPRFKNNKTQGSCVRLKSQSEMKGFIQQTTEIYTYVHIIRMKQDTEIYGHGLWVNKSIWIIKWSQIRFHKAALYSRKMKVVATTSAVIRKQRSHTRKPVLKLHCWLHHHFL